MLIGDEPTYDPCGPPNARFRVCQITRGNSSTSSSSCSRCVNIASSPCLQFGMRAGYASPSRACIRFLRSLVESPRCLHHRQTGVCRWQGPTVAHAVTARRSVKTLSFVNSDELDSCDAESRPKPRSERAGDVVYPTVVQQALDNMKKYENCVLLTRVGSFYEVNMVEKM